MRRERNFIGPAGMGGMVGLWGASSLIRSVQRGTISTTATSATATIAAVNTANTVVVFLGMTQTQANVNLAVAIGRVTLTNATTITATLGANAGTAVFSYEVIEYQPGVIKSVQLGTVAVAGNASATATVTAVDTNKSCTVMLGWSIGTVAAPTADQFAMNTVLTNATTITATRAIADAGNSITVGFLLVEFF